MFVDLETGTVLNGPIAELTSSGEETLSSCLDHMSDWDIVHFAKDHAKTIYPNK